MNKFYVALLCLLCGGMLHAQTANDPVRSTLIQPYHLAISEQQTTNLIFPYPVQRVHCASRELDIEQMKDVKNILLVRSVAQGFSPTNLSVVTTDGRFYSFSLEYAHDPSHLNVRFVVDSSVRDTNPVAVVPMNDAEMYASSRIVEKQKKHIKLLKRNQQVKLSLDGLFIRHNLLWMAMTVSNASLINYPIDYVKVFTRDRTRSKKTIIQEREIEPVFIQQADTVKGGDQSRIILAFEPFTIPFNKILAIQLAEKTGGRFIELRAGSQVFYKTKELL